MQGNGWLKNKFLIDFSVFLEYIICNNFHFMFSLKVLEMAKFKDLNFYFYYFCCNGNLELLNLNIVEI